MGRRKLPFGEWLKAQRTCAKSSANLRAIPAESAEVAAQAFFSSPNTKASSKFKPCSFFDALSGH